ncbi:TetR family transcriptional regulator [Streptomyces sp. NPDC060209]|uniref:TetR family transcriptional regulator n=1 Tax=Streptomyces sp. NPDC060209 TaxID=3347073 RepID=UPI0036611532
MAQQGRALRTRDALIESAAEIFDRQGFTLASLSMISSHAGVSNGALHFHFANKASLADAVAAAAELRLTRITGRHEGRPPGGSLQLLIDTTHDLVRELGEDVLLRVGFNTVRSLDRSGASADSRDLWAAWVGETLDRAREERVLRQDAPADAVVATLVATTLSLGVLTQSPPVHRADTVTHLWGLLLPRLVTGAFADRLMPSGTPAESH